jgi:hypothetical protein
VPVLRTGTYHHKKSTSAKGSAILTEVPAGFLQFSHVTGSGEEFSSARGNVLFVISIPVLLSCLLSRIVGPNRKKLH